MEGEPTTAGCRAVAARAVPAMADAACLAGARAAGARIVGRTNLHELALGVTGVNPWYGTPVNPLDPGLVPGGSSSGSAVAVATGEADVAYGSDTGGSVRIPAACCGTAGLKTTWGRVPLGGVWPLSPSFDTVGPLARDVAGLVTGMELLEPGFIVAGGRRRLHRGPVAHQRRPGHHRRHRPGTPPGRLGLLRPALGELGRRHHAGRPPPRRRGMALRRHPRRGAPRGHRRRRAGPPPTRVGVRRPRHPRRMGGPSASGRRRSSGSSRRSTSSSPRP